MIELVVIAAVNRSQAGRDSILLGNATIAETLAEALHATTRIQDLLLAGIEGMAG